MSKQEFIDRLRAALNGRVAPSLVTDHVNFYEEYINTEIRKGRSEEDVMNSLGDPRLIAKTIIETNGKNQEAFQQTAEDTYTGNYGQETEYHNTTESRHFRFPGWVWAFIGVFVIVCVIGIVFSVLSFLAPIIIPVLVVFFLIKLFRDWLN